MHKQMRKQISLFGFVLVSSLLGLATQARADVTGRWQGQGEWTYEGSGTNCPVMLLAYEETATSLKRTKGFFECGVVALHSDPIAWERQGQELSLDGEKAGEINENGFTASEGYSSDVSVTTKFTLKGQTADYLEIWRGKDGKDIYVIRGTFKKVK